MENFLGFIGVAGAIIASMGLAMWLEWCCLSWLMRLMPGRQAPTSAGTGREHVALEPDVPEEPAQRAA
jgi:hypothetical protein